MKPGWSGRHLIRYTSQMRNCLIWLSASRAAPLVLLTLGVGLACVEGANDKPAPEDLELIKKNLLGSAPAPHFRANANIADKVVYLGLDVSPVPLAPGRTVTLTHYWQVKEPPGKEWRMFVHAQGPAGAGRMNLDHGAVQDKYPASKWKAGDIVRDEHTFQLPASFSQATLEIYVGLWRGGERMPVKSGPHDQNGRVLAATIPVKAGSSRMR